MEIAGWKSLGGNRWSLARQVTNSLAGAFVFKVQIVTYMLIVTLDIDKLH